MFEWNFLFQAKFKRFLYTGDVVLLELDSNLNYTQTAISACMSKEEISTEQICMTAGWGVYKPGGKF